ncbi:MAG: DUF1592 domain-containing protein [Verrucomicrobia bacterium]|nr:DUF1592 domain-containing protein [Verrucomicrobiota bacterium]
MTLLQHRLATARSVLRRFFRASWAWALALHFQAQSASPAAPTPPDRGFLQQYCFDCHDEDQAKAGLNLDRLSNPAQLNADFRIWEKVLRAVDERRMPPKDRTRPDDEARRRFTSDIQRSMTRLTRQLAGTPGRTGLRRLTSAEYDYAILDLTGLDLNLGQQFINDAVGGEGFSNVSEVQFLDDVGLERYLGAAKSAAAHALIGAGSLGFFQHPGMTGLEISAVERIQALYRKHGFRKAAGEGAEPYGQDLYAKALLANWQFKHRKQLGRPKEDLGSFARSAGVSPKFAGHLRAILENPSPSFPTTEMVKAWNLLPVPSRQFRAQESEILARCTAIQHELDAWQSALAVGPGNNEEAPVLAGGQPEVMEKQILRIRLPFSAGHPAPTLRGVARSVGDNPSAAFVLILRDVRTLLVDEATNQLSFGIHPHGSLVSTNDLVLTRSMPFELPFKVAPEAKLVAHNVVVELDAAHSDDSLVHLELKLANSGIDPLPPLLMALLAPPRGQARARHREGFAALARDLPQVSHREPAPSDRDPIPDPYDNKYESPDRNYFHYQVKYHREDAFLVEKILDEPARRELDAAWADLLLSFEYHDIKLRFLNRKFELGLETTRVKDLQPSQLGSASPRIRAQALELKENLERSLAAWRGAESNQLEDTLQFAQRAWRRPLTESERGALVEFYRRMRVEDSRSHPEALRSLLARVLMSPAFLYRLEPAARAGIHRLGPRELASRLSFFLWSSLPDEMLLRAAERGELSDPKSAAKWVRRMVQDPRARRLATEFFGQWFGFYRFERYEGVDRTRFPEFTPSLRASFHQEAIEFFSHLIQGNRPVDDVLFANYSFLNAELANHYAIGASAAAGAEFVQHRFAETHRGGLFGLGAILTKTSTPLRTSPVKRGDWVLRQILGTPPPPPPPDAGSLASDDVLADGLSVLERLDAHRRRESCSQCHALFDPLGFSLEHLDPVGRYRDAYRDGKTIVSSGVLGSGERIEGVAGLKSYLREHRDLFHETFATRLLGYALGRKTLLSDRPLIQKMKEQCARGGSLADLAMTLVSSSQFQHIQGTEAGVVVD